MIVLVECAKAYLMGTLVYMDIVAKLAGGCAGLNSRCAVKVGTNDVMAQTVGGVREAGFILS